MNETPIIETTKYEKTLNPLEQIEELIDLEDKERQVLFQLVDGKVDGFIILLGDDGNEISTTSIYKEVLIKPYSRKAKVVLSNTLGKEEKVVYKITTGLRLL